MNLGALLGIRFPARPAPEPEVRGLLGLMLLQESHRAARTSRDGDLILLEVGLE